MPLAISQGFLDGFVALQPTVRSKVAELIRKFNDDSSAAGLHLERPEQRADDRARTLRVDRSYRAVVMAPEDSDTYVLVGVFPHDDAYEWCARHRFSVNHATGALEIERLEAIVAAESVITVGSKGAFFADRRDRDFEQLGIASRFLPLIYAIETEEQAATLADLLPPSQGAALTMLAAGYSVEEAWTELCAGEPAVGIDETDVVAAVARPASGSMFYVVRDDADLVALLNQPMARWRVFLHPSQRRVALRQSYSGPARVMGGAGTGKTVVLLHRARFLAERETGSERRILVTTFTRNLATDLSRSLADLAGAQVMDRVEVTTVDALAHRIVRENRGVQVNACRDVEELRLFEEAVRASGCHLVPEVVRQEWRQVILAQDLTTRDAYFTTPRLGRGVRVSRSDRAAIWKACEEAQRLLGSRRTFLQLANEAARILAVIPSPPYNHILVDEAQDLHPAQWRLLRAAVRGGPDDLFIAGDTHQRIYGNRITLGSLGIDIRGRSARLTLNYRTTHEILRWALGILRGQAFDDLDDGSATLAGYRSTMHGPAPTVEGCATESAELAAMVRAVEAWLRNGLAPAEIGVCARTRGVCDRALDALERAGLPAAEIGGDTPRYHDSTIAVGTMHRMKGLEFRRVAILGVSEGLIPPENAVTPITVDPLEHARDLQRERCLLYVACSRARDDLRVSWSPSPSPLIAHLVGANAASPELGSGVGAALTKTARTHVEGRP